MTRLSPEGEAYIAKMVSELPPLTDEQLDALADTLAAIRISNARRMAAGVCYCDQMGFNGPCGVCRAAREDDDK